MFNVQWSMFNGEKLDGSTYLGLGSARRKRQQGHGKGNDYSHTNLQEP